MAKDTSDDDEEPEGSGGKPGKGDRREPEDIFEPTSWSLISRARGEGDRPDRDRAFRELFDMYREPIAQLMRRHATRAGLGDPNVDDFFGYLFERRALDDADRFVGRFRQYIQGVLRNYLRESYRKARSDGSVPLEAAGGDPAGREASDDAEAEDERAWSRGLFDEAFARLARANAEAAHLVRRHYLDDERASTEELASELGVERSLVHRKLSRARERLGRIIDELLREGVVSDADFEDERRWLIDRLRRAWPGLNGWDKGDGVGEAESCDSPDEDEGRDPGPDPATDDPDCP